MKDELELALVEDFSPWFEGYNQTVQESCLAWGFQCGDGWEPLIRRLCEDLKRIGAESDFRVVQVKEKFGGLRFYCSGGPDELYDRIALAEEESYKTCERCGAKENVTSEGGWIKTLCKRCRDAKEDKG